MRWIHLTDLHIGRPTDHAQEAALVALVDSIKQEVGGSAVDAVLLTGDLAHSGKADEYELLNNRILTPLRSLPEFKTSVWFATAGNHDLDSGKSLPISWDTLGRSRQEKFFAESPEGIA